jgi:predicted permease
MRISRALLWLIARIVPSHTRGRWIEEWRAELLHGRRTMMLGAVPDAFAMRSLPPKGGSHQSSVGSTRWLPPLGGRTSSPSIFHAVDQDIRYGLRGLLAAPGFVLGVVLSLAIGIGANVVAFSFINAAVFRPFPDVTKQHELARIAVGSIHERFGLFMHHGANFDTIRGGFTTLSELSAHKKTPLAVLAGNQAIAAPGALVSSNYFSVLGVRPAAGRFFNEDEDRVPWSHAVVVVSDRAWDRLYARDPAAVGRTVSVNGATLQIVGVAPAEFAGVGRVNPDERPDFWIPLGLADLVLRDPQGKPVGMRASGDIWFDYVGRRRPGVTMDEVNAEASVLATHLTTGGGRALTVKVSRVWLNDPAESAPAILSFMVIPLLVLAIACVNAGNLMLARAARQGRDWTVRLALGASRWRVVRQVLTEAAILAGGAGSLGLALSQWAIQLVTSQVPVPMPLDFTVAIFTVAIALVTALAFSLGPALGLTRKAARRMAPAASTAPVSRSRIRFALVAVQAALSFGLLTTGVQFTKTVLADNPNAATIPDPERLVLAAFDVDPLRFEPEAGHEFYRRLVNRVRQMPGVSAAGLSTPGLVTGAMGPRAGARLWLPDSPSEGVAGFVPLQVSPHALPAIAVPLLQGRHFNDVDGRTLRSVIVNQPFAQRYFGGAAMGRSFRLASSVSPELTSDVTVVGIADGIMKRGDSEPPILYHPAPLAYEPARMLYVRLDESGVFTTAALHAAVRGVDVRVPVGETSTLRSINSSRNTEWKLLAQGAAALGILALVLAAGGLYSVVSYVVSLRRQEVGIRLALGADGAAVVRMIVRQALTPTLIGAAVGAGGAAAAGAVIRSRMYGASTTDPLTYAAAGVLMVLVMVAASWIPARQAGRVDPLQVLRTE